MEENEKEQPQGAFVSSLKRSNKDIRGDRAEAIAEDAGIAFKRVVEDIAIEIRKKTRERSNMLDLSPTNALSLMVADDFDSSAFVERDLKLAVEIRNLEIKFELANTRLKELFGEEI